MSTLNTISTKIIAAAALLVISFGCSDSDDPKPLIANYFLGIESASDPAVDVLSSASAIESGTISPVGNGFEQPAWMTFIQGKDQIFATGYTSAPEFTSYELVDGTLTKGASFFTDLQLYAFDIVDESTAVLVGSPREGLTDKKLYRVNTNTMTIDATVSSDFGNDIDNNLLAFPVDVKVRGNQLFAAYYMVSADGSFATPDANQARVAVFSYPDMVFEKVITDDRASNVGRYLSTNALEIDENGDIYTFSSSSLACGFAPVPANNSSILRIKEGESTFDPDYYIDFETLSEGYKINDLFYVANGKAVVRVVKEDETNAAFLWATYAPTGQSPLLETGIVDLNNKTFKLLSNVPKGGGGWSSSYMVEGTKLYLGVSYSSYAGIYVIDTENDTATEGAKIDGNYAKAILALYDS